MLKLLLICLIKSAVEAVSIIGQGCWSPRLEGKLEGSVGVTWGFQDENAAIFSCQSIFLVALEEITILNALISVSRPDLSLSIY